MGLSTIPLLLAKSSGSCIQRFVLHQEIHPVQGSPQDLPQSKRFSVFYSRNYLAVYYAFKFLPCWIIYLFCRNQRRRYISSVNWDRREIISVKQNSRSGDHKNNLHPLSTCLIGFVENMRRVFLSKIHGLIWSEVVSQINGVLCS